MNIKKIFTIITASIIVLSLYSCKKTDSEGWAVKIDDDVITIDEFYKFYYTQNKLLFNKETNEEIDKLTSDPSSLTPQLQQFLNKKNFMDQLISQKLIMKKAKNDESIDKDELNSILEIAQLQAVSTYYLSKIFKDEIVITDEEIDEFYNKNRKLFKGVPISDMVISRIKQQIFLMKSRKKSNEYIMNLLAESKVNKEGFKKHLRKLEDKKANPDTEKSEQE